MAKSFNVLTGEIEKDKGKKRRTENSVGVIIPDSVLVRNKHFVKCLKYVRSFNI